MKGNCGECVRRWYCETNPDDCDEWTGHVPMTNADRIRAMTDEELEEGILKMSIGYGPWCDNHCKMSGDDDCNRCLRSWLQKPAQPPKEE